MVKAGTSLYSDRIQKENIQRFQSWKSLILKTLESLFELMVLNVNAGFYFELSWYWCFPLCWNSKTSLVTQQKKLNKHFSLNQLKVLRSFFFNNFEDQMEIYSQLD